MVHAWPTWMVRLDSRTISGPSSPPLLLSTYSVDVSAFDPLPSLWVGKEGQNTAQKDQSIEEARK